MKMKFSLRLRYKKYAFLLTAVNLAVILQFQAGCTNHSGKTFHSRNSSAIMEGLPQPPIEDPTRLPHEIIAPTNFIKQIALADRIVVRPISPDPLFRDLSLTLVGKEVRDVVKAVSLLKNDRVIGWGYASCNCENWKMEFYHGINLIGTALFVQDVVDIVGEYRDLTGTFAKIDNKISDRMMLLIPSN